MTKIDVSSVKTIHKGDKTFYVVNDEYYCFDSKILDYEGKVAEFEVKVKKQGDKEFKNIEFPKEEEKIPEAKEPEKKLFETNGEATERIKSMLLSYAKDIVCAEIEAGILATTIPNELEATYTILVELFKK